ncbi:hypothetical protein QTO34_020101, partial [Cnephaeus nilssonii]
MQTPGSTEDPFNGFSQDTIMIIFLLMRYCCEAAASEDAPDHQLLLCDPDTRGRQSAGAVGPGVRRRIRRRRRAPPGSLRALGRCGRVTQTAQPEAAVAVARGLRAGAGSGLWLSEAPRRAEPAARRGAMEIGTEISRKIRVRPAGGGGGGKPGLGGRAVVRSNGVVGPAWTPRPGRRPAAPPWAWGLTRPRACGGGQTCRGRESSCGEAEGGGDEELPDYIMVMVANKKSQDQMTEDLSLFLGNNTIRFTVWLHGVLDKLRSVTTDPSSLKSSDTNIFDSNVPSNKSSFSRGDEKARSCISSTRPEKRDSRVSSSSQEQKATNVRQSYDDGAATRLMSTVKPLREPAPSEDVIDIKPEPDDLIDEDLNFKKPTVTLTYGSSRPSIEIYRPPASRTADGGVHLNRLQFQQQQNSIHAAKQLDVQNSRVYETGRLCEPEVLNSLEETYSPFFRNNAEKMSIEEENFRKRKLPVVSSVVKVKKFNHDGEEEEEDDDCGSRTGSISSSVSVPAKPERRPSLPPSKQANKNLILKAISEAQESVTKTTNYSTVSQKQTLPVAPRTRTSQEELLAEMVQGQSRTSRISPPIKEDEAKGDNIEKGQ